MKRGRNAQERVCNNIYICATIARIIDKAISEINRGKLAV